MRAVDPSVTLYENNTKNGNTVKLLVFNRTAREYLKGWDRARVEFLPSTQMLMMKKDDKGNRKVIRLERAGCIGCRIYVKDIVPLSFEPKTNFDIYLMSPSEIALLPSQGTRVFTYSGGHVVEVGS